MLSAQARLRRFARALAPALLTALVAAPSAQAATAGVQTHLLWGGVDAAETTRQLDAAKAMGAKIVRVDAGWASWEPEAKGQRSSWYLGRMDAVVDKAEARGLQVLFTLWETPCWASSAPAALKQDCTGAWWDRNVQRYPPRNAADFADAVAFIARRYGTRVAGYEIWNEPNASHYLVAEDPVAAYATLLKAAYPAIKAAAPGARVIGGSLMWADMDFTQKLYAHGIKGKFDAWSIHPYSDDRSALDPGSSQWLRGSFIRGVPLVRDVLVRNGDDKPLWLTEFGWSTTSLRGAENWLNGVDEATQARYVGEGVRAMAGWSYVEVGIYFNLKDMGTDPRSTIENFGLTGWDGRRKPAFEAFRVAASELHAGTAQVPTAQDPGTVQGLTGAEAGQLPEGDIGEAYSASGGPGRPVRVTVTKVSGGLRMTGRTTPKAKVKLVVRLRKGSKPLTLATRADKRGRFTRVLKAKRISSRNVRVTGRLA